MLSPSKCAFFALLLLTSDALCKPLFPSHSSAQAFQTLEDTSKERIGAENSVRNTPPEKQNRFEIPHYRETNEPPRRAHQSDPFTQLRPRPKTEAQKANEYGNSYGPGGKALGYLFGNLQTLLRQISRPFKWLFTPFNKEITDEEAETLARFELRGQQPAQAPSPESVTSTNEQVPTNQVPSPKPQAQHETVGPTFTENTKVKTKTEEPAGNMPPHYTDTDNSSPRTPPGPRPNPSPRTPSGPRLKTEAQKANEYGNSYGPGGKALGYVWGKLEYALWKISGSLKWLFTPFNRKNELSDGDVEIVAEHIANARKQQPIFTPASASQDVPTKERAH